MVTKKKLSKEEWEAMTGTDMSLILPSDGCIETARESSLNDTGKEKSEGTVDRTDSTSENQQPPTGKEEVVSAFQRRISSRQRKLSLDEYRKTFLQVPRIEDRKGRYLGDGGHQLLHPTKRHTAHQGEVGPRTRI